MLVLDYSKLKELHRLKRDNYTDEFSIRIHRSLSWIGRAEKKTRTLTHVLYFTG